MSGSRMKKSIIEAAWRTGQIIGRPEATSRIIYALPLRVIKNIECLCAKLNNSVLRGLKVLKHANVKV